MGQRRSARQHRAARGRKPQPTAAVITRRRVPDIDSRSARTTKAGGPSRHDGGKKVSGRKRHILVDTAKSRGDLREGSLPKARVHPADIHGRRGAELLLAGLAARFSPIALPWADSAYQGLKAWLATTLGWVLTVSRHWWTGLHGVWAAPGQKPPEIPRSFHVLKRRWVVERTFAWVGRNRRMSRDYERLIKTSGMLLYAAMARVAPRGPAK